MSRKTAEQWREWRKTHREQYLSNQRKRRARMTQAERDERLAKRREKYACMSDADRAYEYARGVESRNRRQEQIAENKRAYCLKHKDRLRAANVRWKEMNYQHMLEIRRSYTKRKCEEEGRVYKPRLSMRMPSFVECPAHARHLRNEAFARKQKMTVGFATAIQSGLTVGRFAK